MDYIELYKKADSLIEKSFEGVYDKGGISYVEHPRRVAAMIEDERAKVVALLHDTLEDTNYTYEDLIALGFPKEIVDAVSILTIRKGEKYPEYIDRVIQSNNLLALTVKKSDMEDNQNPERLLKLEESERLRLTKKYKNEYKKVISAYNKRKDS